MKISEAKKVFIGFTTFHNKNVPYKYRYKKDKLWYLYAEELINTGKIVLDENTTLNHKKCIWPEKLNKRSV